MAKQYFKKNDKIKYLDVIGGKVNTYCEELGIYNPTLEQFHSVGWEDYTPAPVPPYEPTREEKIQRDIREKYTASDEYMILRHYAANPTQYADEFAEYHTFVESVIAKYPEE